MATVNALDLITITLFRIDPFDLGLKKKMATVVVAVVKISSGVGNHYGH